MFTSSPHFATLTRQVAQALAEKIRRGEFGLTLPAERWLAHSLQVSRRTVRGALALLRQDNLLETIRGRETRIVRTPARRTDPTGPRAIGLVLPASIDQLESYSTVHFDILRALLFQHGFRLETHASPNFFSRRPDRALIRLTTRFPSAGWILAFSNRPSQSWFHARQLCTVVAGTAHEGVDLPFVDVDMRATALHAARHLLSLGHRRLALIINEKNRAGDRLTEEGFMAGIGTAAGTAASGLVLRHDATMDGLRRMTRRLLALSPRPTALFIANPYHYTGVACLLAERGIKVPRDLSLLCRDHDYSLLFQPVEPGRYVYSPEKRARAIFAVLMATLHDRTAGRSRHVLALPQLVRGASVARIKPVG